MRREREIPALWVLGGYPLRVDEFTQHRCGAVRHRSAAVTGDSAIVTDRPGIVPGHSGRLQKAVALNPESPVTFGRNRPLRSAVMSGHDAAEYRCWNEHSTVPATQP